MKNHKEIYRTCCEDYDYTQYILYCSCGKLLIAYTQEDLEEKFKQHSGGKTWTQKLLNKKANY